MSGYIYNLYTAFFTLKLSDFMPVTTIIKYVRNATFYTLKYKKDFSIRLILVDFKQDLFITGLEFCAFHAIMFKKRNLLFDGMKEVYKKDIYIYIERMWRLTAITKENVDGWSERLFERKKTDHSRS